MLIHTVIQTANQVTVIYMQCKKKKKEGIW